MKSLARTPSQKSGFTLLELLIVLAILIVIIGILGTTVWSSYKKALVRAATVQVTTTLTNACEDFRLDFKRYPTNEEGLYILADMDNPNAPAQQDAGMGGKTPWAAWATRLVWAVKRHGRRHDRHGRHGNRAAI